MITPGSAAPAGDERATGRMESGSLPAQERVWRVRWLDRVGLLCVAAGLIALAVTLVMMAHGWRHLLPVIPGVAILVAASIVTLRRASSKVVLTADSVLIRNAFDTHHVPLGQVISVDISPRGSLVLSTVGGERIYISAIRPSTAGQLSGRGPRVNELMEAIEQAASAYGAQVPPQLPQHAAGASAAGPVTASPLSAVPPRLETGPTSASEASVEAAGLVGTGSADEGRFPRHAGPTPRPHWLRFLLFFSARSRPRPTWQYLLFCLGFLVTAVVGAAVGGTADTDHIGWLSTAMEPVVGFGLAGVIVAFGRGVFRGRLRRAFWRYPPPWTYPENPQSVEKRALASASGASVETIGLGGAGIAGDGRFPRRSWSPGYRASEVDALIERIEATLAGTTGPEQAVTAAEVRTARFGTIRRGGYDPSMVDQALEAYAGQLELKHGG